MKIICPNLKNPDVAREFNELKEATSSRAAYAIWSLNNGNGIDKAPNGAESKLFLTLLESYGYDRTEAIRAKAKIYSKSFREWFGDWTGQEGASSEQEESIKNDVSKVVDENGEPLIVYRIDYEKFPVFDKSKIGTNLESYFGKGFYFTPSFEYASMFPGTYIRGFFLNAKNEYNISDPSDQKLKELENSNDSVNWVRESGKPTDEKAIKKVAQESFDDNGVYNTEIDHLRKLIDDNAENITFELAKLIYDAIRNVAVEDGKVPGTSVSDRTKIIKEAFKDSLKEKEYFAVDTEEDILFDLPSDEADAQIELYELKKQHPELNLKLESSENIDKEYFDILDEFTQLVKSSEIFQNIYDLVDYTKNAVNKTRDLYKEEELIVFDPHQIKSAFDNTGIFSEKTENVYDDYGTISELNNYDQSVDSWVIDQILQAQEKDPNADVLKVAQDAKKQWVETRQLEILNDTQMRLAEAYGLRKEVGEDGRIRFVSDTNDEKSQLIIDFLDYISGDTEGYYDYNSKSSAAHHVIGISLTNGDPSTFSHELAHHYVRMFWNSKLIQTALRAVDKPGMSDTEREEALIDIITARTNDSDLSVIESQSFVQKFWAAFANMLYTVFGIENEAIRNQLYKNITRAFVMNEQQRLINSQNVVFKMADSRMYKKSNYKQKLKEARDNARRNRSAVLYEQVGSDKTQKAIKSIIQGSISRNKLYRKSNVENPKTLVEMQIAEDRVRRFVDDINQYRENYLNSLGTTKPTRKQRSQRAHTPEELAANVELIRGFIQQATDELYDLAGKFKSMQSTMYGYYLSKEITNPSTGDTVVEYLDMSHLNEPGVTATQVDFKELSDINQNILGFYDKTIKDLYSAIFSVEFKNLYGEDVQSELLSAITSVNSVATGDVKLNDMIKHLTMCYQEAITKKLRQFIHKYVNENAQSLTDDQKETLIYSTNTWLENQNAFGDIGIMETWLGLASNSKSSLIRIMQDIIDNMSQKQNDAVNQRGYELREKRKAAMIAASKAFFKDDFKAYGFLSPYNIDKLLMESDDDGFTGNFITPVNEGAYHNNRLKFINKLIYDKGGILDKIRQRLGDKKYELEIDSNGEPVFPEGQEDIEREYLHEVNRWTGKNAVRRFTVAYYDKRIDMLSSTTRKAQTQIQNQINEIIRACTIDGKIHTELLSRTKMNDLQRLYYRKSQLSNPFDEYGRRKPDGSDEALIAKELSEWNEWLSEHIKNKMDYEAFEEAKRNAKDKDYFERVNTYRTINPEIWEEIQRMFPSVSSQQINNLRQTRAKLISITKGRGLVNPNIDRLIDRLTGKIRPEFLEFWENLRKFDQQIEALKESSSGKKWTKALQLLYKSLMTSLPITIDLPSGISMSWYSYIQKQIKARLEAQYGKNDPRVASEFANEMKQFEYVVRGANGQLSKKGPLSIFYLTQPPAKRVKLQKGFVDSVVREPIQAYSVVDAENSDPAYVDTRFDETSGNFVQPITDDTRINPDDVSYTSKKYKKYIENGPRELKDYYDELIKTMKDSYENVPFAGKYDNRLPLQGATTGQMFHRKDWWNIGKPLLFWAKRNYTINESDTDINIDYELRPDGTRSMNIPVRYIKRLDNPNEINSDILGSVISFYEMSQNYKNKSEALPLFLTVIDKIQHSNSNRDRLKKFLKGIVNRAFYDRSRNFDMSDDNLATYTNLWAKRALKWIPGLRMLTTTGLLALNFLAGIVAYLDPAIQIAVDALSGRYIGMDDYILGTLKMLERLPAALVSAGKSRSYDKVSSGMVKFGLAKSGSYNFRNMDRNQLRRFLKDGIVMLPFSLGEHTVNALVFCTIMNSYKYVEDKAANTATYMNKKQYYEWAQSKGMSMKEAKLKFITLPTLFNAYETNKSGIFVTKDNKFGHAVTPELENTIGKRMRNRAAVSNLIVPGTERTKILSNIITAFTVVMRTFMLVGLGERFRSLRDFQIPDEAPVDETVKSDTTKKYKLEYYAYKGGYNFQTDEIEDGIYSAAAHIFSNLSGYLQYFWYNLKHPFRSKYNDATQKFMENHKIAESDLYGLDRIATELLAFGFLVVLQTVFHNKMVDDGDDDKYWYQVLDHILIRTALVRLTWFSPDTFMDLINTITPSKSDIDKKLKLIDLIKDAYKGFQEHGTHYEDWEKVKSGGYKNTPKAFRDLLQTFSSLGLHNIYTSSSVEGVKSKTKWFKPMVLWSGYWHDAKTGKRPSGRSNFKVKSEFDDLNNIGNLNNINNLDDLNGLGGL